ncbi:ankyrin [Phaeosphaeriaceae sp. SRC1lsM3a]|nr:ankyrin [Stagonospora sp. SRC1lsM3a]
MESKSKISLPWHKKPEKKFDKPLLANPPNPPLGPAVSWVDVESRFDKPSVDLAKIFAKKNTSTADVTSKVERLLNLGANPNLVICTIRTEKNELILQPVDAKPGEGLTEAFWWHTVGTESTLFAFCVPLLEVARSGNIDTIQLFSRHGACINKVIERVISCGHSTKLLLNPFLGPYSMDRLKAVLTLIEPGQPLIYKWAATGVKLGLELGPQHDLEFVRLLLTAGAIPSGLSSPQRIAPRTMDLAVRRSIVPATLSEEQPDLINAAWKDDVQACNDALSRDPNTEIRGAFGMTALIISVGGLSSAPICRLLLDRGAAVDTFDVFGMTPLMEAIYYGHREAVMSLLDCGADVHYRIKGEPLTDFVGGTPTTYFRQESWLVQRNINARMCKTSGWNAVHMAAHRGFTELLAVLVRHGAVLEVKDVGGYTPLDLAVKNGHGATADFILRVRGSPAGKSDLRDLHSIVGGSMLSIRDRESNPLQQDDWAPKVSTRIHVDPETGSDNNSEIKTAQENPQICPRCAKAFKSGNFDVVRTFNSTFCRFCIMLNSDKWATELSHVDHVKDSNMTYVRFFEPGGSEVSLHRVRKVPRKQYLFDLHPFLVYTKKLLVMHLTCHPRFHN